MEWELSLPEEISNGSQSERGINEFRRNWNADKIREIKGIESVREESTSWSKLNVKDKMVDVRRKA